MMTRNKFRNKVRKITSLLLTVIFTLSSVSLAYAGECHNNMKSSHQVSHSHKTHIHKVSDGSALGDGSTRSGVTADDASVLLSELSFSGEASVDGMSAHTGHCISFCTLPAFIELDSANFSYEISPAYQSRVLHSTFSVEIRPPKVRS